MNYLIIAGHLGSDPEVRFTSTGKKVTTIRVATNSRKANVDETIWWRVTIWGEQFDKIIPYFKKGSAIVVSGDIQKPEIFTDREGKQQISLNITANHIQFSPFGKTDRSSQENSVLPSNTSSAFASMREGSSPYAPSGMEVGQMQSPMNDRPFDDEPPF